MVVCSNSTLSEDEVMMTSSRGVVYCAPPVVHIEVFINKLKYNELQASKVLTGATVYSRYRLTWCRLITNKLYSSQ